MLTVDELADSIREIGILSPLMVRRFGKEFQIVSGHRRKAALELLGEKYADCDIVDMTDEQAYRALMVANIQAQTLSEIEEAEGIKSMMEQFEWTQERVSKEFGKSQVWVNRRLDLLNLEPDIKEQIITRVITATHGREIGQLPVHQQSEVVQKVVEGNLSTRQTAELVKQTNHQIGDQLTDHEIHDSLTECEIQDSSNEMEIQARSTVPKVGVSEELKSLKDRSLNNEIYGLEPRQREYPRHIKASNYITKFYEFLANLDEDTIDGIIELDEVNHVLAVIGKAEDQMKWIRTQISKIGANASGTVVEFRKKEA